MTEPQPPKTTKAWAYTAGGLPRQTLHLTTTHPYPIFPPPRPQNKKEEEEEEYILVRTSHAALNPGDALLMNLLPTILRTTTSPKVPGYDLVGEVLAVSSPPSSSTPPASFQPGDKIIAFLTASYILSTHTGALQGHIAFPAKYAVRLPGSIAPSPYLASPSPERKEIPHLAAGLLLTACTALQQIRDAGVKPGDRVLVYGASGGVGSMAVQLAREVVGTGGRVVGVCSGGSVKAVMGLGVVDEVVDYATGGVFKRGEEGVEGKVDGGRGEGKGVNVAEELRRLYGGEEKFDAVVDCFGNQGVYKRCAGFLKREGVYSGVGIHASGYGYGPVLWAGLIMLGNAVWPRSTWLGGTGRTWKAASMFDPGREMMEYLVGLFGEGKLRVLVDSEWAFEDVLEGYDVLLSGRAKGKVVVRFGDGGQEVTQ